MENTTVIYKVWWGYYFLVDWSAPYSCGLFQSHKLGHTCSWTG